MKFVGLQELIVTLKDGKGAQKVSKTNEKAVNLELIFWNLVYLKPNAGYIFLHQTPKQATYFILLWSKNVILYRMLNRELLLQIVFSDYTNCFFSM